MLSPKTQYSLYNAALYFSEHLAVGDYYSQTNSVIGQWIGVGSKTLGLPPHVQRDAFVALCENRHPVAGGRLTARTKTTRNAGTGEVANRRVFFDFTISPPKSVSVLALVAGDERIRLAHRAALRSAFSEMERFAATRVHQGDSICERKTQNMIAALFEHETSRALDPHLHTHCVVFNATYDLSEQRWKALDPAPMLRARKFIENIYYHELAQALQKLGYETISLPRGDFAVAQVPLRICEKFSKRHQDIDQRARAFLAEHPNQNASLAEVRDLIAHKDRERKAGPISISKLRAHWNDQLTAEEREALKPVAFRPEIARPLITAAEAVDWAEEHLFDRRSVVWEHELWSQALEYARGSALSITNLQAETLRRDYLRQENGKLTRRDILEREKAIVEMVAQHRGGFESLAPIKLTPTNRISDEQAAAMRQILGSRDMVTLFRGGAGTGKSFVLRRIQKALDQNGHVTLVAAPQRQQVIDLENDGFHNVSTVAKLLKQNTLPRGCILIVDEAGQIGGRQLHALLELASQSKVRLILSGDTRQHGPVECSDALRAIESFACTSIAEVREIRRQNPDHAKTAVERIFIEGYREAVHAASEGHITQSFDKLQTMGAVVECSPERETEMLAREYFALRAKGESTLVVSQTWDTIHNLNEKIRERLADANILHGNETQVTALERIELTSAQKRQASSHPEDSVVVFNQPHGNIERGSTGRFVSASPADIIVEVENRLMRIKAFHLDRITVCRQLELKLRGGDQIQLKANANSSKGFRFANGEIVTVRSVAPDGEIHLVDGRILPASYRQFGRGYAVTSYGSQGKTVDHVLFADSAVRAATNAQQWYVSISRGRKSVRIFTSDASALRNHIQTLGNRELALEMAEISPPQRANQNLSHSILKNLTLKICNRLARLVKRNNTQTEVMHP